MDLWVTTLLPIVTLVLGAGLTFAADQWRRKQQIEREDRLRFVADKRQAYVELLTATQDLRAAVRKRKQVHQNANVTERYSEVEHLIQQSTNSDAQSAESDWVNAVREAVKQAAKQVAEHLVPILQEEQRARTEFMRAGSLVMLFATSRPIFENIESIRRSIQDNSDQYYEEYTRFVGLARQDLGLPSLDKVSWPK